MNERNHIPVDFDRIGRFHDLDYADGDIAVITDIKEFMGKRSLPVDLDIYIVANCVQGELQIDIDGVQYDISRHMLLFCKPGEIISNCVVSPDFRGGMMLLSHRSIVDSFSCSDFWDIGLELSSCRTIVVEDIQPSFFLCYSALLRMKMQSDNKLFRKEILQSIVKAAIYELLSILGKDNSGLCCGLIKQREVLFRNFIILLTGQKVKARNISWYADRLCVSSKYLSSVCKAVSGKTAFEWINDYMLGDIRRLLRNSSKSIKEIASYLEFPSLSFFGKYVKSHTGMSPTEYREMLRHIKPDEMQGGV